MGVAAAVSDESPAWQTEIGAGESLVLLSRWSGSSVEEIGELNQMDVRDSLYPGQRIKLPLADDAQIEAFQDARARGQQDRIDRYLSSRGGLVDVDVHVVRTGETAWQVARDETGIPLWVLASFNQDTDLQNLGIGQPLQVPVLGDTVASLDFEEVDSIQIETVGLPIDFD
jgi:LysM repeat protein